MEKKTYYVLKVKGKAKIPDYVQVRDEDFTLVGYFRPSRSEGKRAPAIGDGEHSAALFAAIEARLDAIPYGTVCRVEWDGDRLQQL
ncbi:MAG: fructose-6-phosphate aldolase [Bacteroidia bacterium]|nr:fructose-6-phosphate aldolase [Bacteroidia bacterium]MDW8334772.1 fructose-6-phosphate aldolase [Bacteroidia bacterium]